MMLKQLFALAILSSSVFCRFTPNDRQLKAGADQGTGNAWQYCNDTCNTECEKCEDHHVCEPNEKRCGFGDVRKGENGVPLPECPKDEKCVDENCGCPVPGKDGKDCPIVCKCDCNEEMQLCCPAGKDHNDCAKQDFCHERGHGKDNIICTGFCPVTCDDNRNYCENPLPEDGCAVEPDCELKAVGDNGKYCEIQQCTLTCTHTYHLCHGDEDVNGCKKKEDKCVPKQAAPTQDGDVMCPGTCPVECQDGWIECDGTVDYSGGIHDHCIGQPTCRNKARNTNGEYCPDNSASHGCPKTCPPDEVLCPAKLGPLECKEELKCHTRTWSTEGEYCAETADCPTLCPPNHVNCPGGVETNTCKKAELCIKEHRDFNGDVCPVHCPENCNDDEVFCPGTRNPINGCFSKDTCESKGVHKWGPTPGSPCPGWCPATCNSHEVLCPSYVDPCNGCPTEEICREAIKDHNGKFCAGKEFTIQVEQEDYRTNLQRRGGFLSASHNCPVYCQEWKGEVQCPVYEDALGCKPKASCKQRQNKKDAAGEAIEGEYCSAASVCPKECPDSQKLCHYEDADEHGCHQEDICVDLDTDKQGNRCTGQDWCPPLCTAAQMLQDNGEDELGCNRAPTCVAVTESGDPNA